MHKVESNTRRYPATRQLLDMCHRGQDHVIAPWLAHNLDTQGQTWLFFGSTGAHNSRWPAGGVVLAGIAGLAAHFRGLFKIQANGRALARRANNEIVLFKPG